MKVGSDIGNVSETARQNGRVRRRVTAILAAHNRVHTTLRAIGALYRQDVCSKIELKVVLVDDGSTDGTEDAVKRTFRDVRVLKGDGTLYWAGAMRVAYAFALREGFDFCLWLNDDTLLDEDAVRRLLETYDLLESRGRPVAIVVGATRDPDSGALSYGGWVSTSRWIPLKVEHLPVSDEPRQCDTMNGNCVLIPFVVAQRVGNISGVFRHSIADLDYGFRARRKGCEIWVAPGYVGSCRLNRSPDPRVEPGLDWRTRLKKMLGPKGLPMLPWLVYVSRHGGVLWPVLWLYPYVSLLWAPLKRTSRHG